MKFKYYTKFYHRLQIERICVSGQDRSSRKTPTTFCNSVFRIVERGFNYNKSATTKVKKNDILNKNTAYKRIYKSINAYSRKLPGFKQGHYNPYLQPLSLLAVGLVRHSQVIKTTERYRHCILIHVPTRRQFTFIPSRRQFAFISSIK